MGKLMNTYHIYTACMSPALSRSSAQERFERSNVSEIRNGRFLPGTATMYDNVLCTRTLPRSFAHEYLCIIYPQSTIPHMSMFAFLGGGVRVTVWISEQKKDQKKTKGTTTKPLMANLDITPQSLAERLVVRGLDY